MGEEEIPIGELSENDPFIDEASLDETSEEESFNISDNDDDTNSLLTIINRLWDESNCILLRIINRDSLFIIFQVLRSIPHL